MTCGELMVRFVRNDSYPLDVPASSNLESSRFRAFITCPRHVRGKASACYGYDAPTGLIASASPEIWENRAACGKRYRITCTAGTNLGVPEPCSATFDLSPDAFAVNAAVDEGCILIEYDQV
nr:EG45-like domain containing protein [Coffea arabica]